MVGRRAVFVPQPTKFSQCVPHRRLKLVLVCFFLGPIRHVESALELVGSFGHLVILIGCSATVTCWYGKAFHLMQAQNGCATWPSVWRVRATLDPDAADKKIGNSKQTKGLGRMTNKDLEKTGDW
ncbi:hypothetical protein DPX16_23617 [Anabarilius grahami]|uniref:Uncharacterized protein n=1 Tax=Anabarilius grahami TaxID=495550 RepID=A0A3N0ZAZ7_ANAGA|nr:hypothetical protein DPX16_23617 [Anabarilius grahami]